jgi:proteasome lid subunit RPN8/RPN11|tara:strand:+ start:1573 stop:2082 length:510 start_codon:yes stop_codon:yes gene_type:complete
MEEEVTENEKAMKEFDWKQHIRDVHNDMADDIEYLFPNNSTEAFMTAIWKMSIDTLEGMEVQVIVDDKDDLYISSGDPSFVSFEGHEDELVNGAPMRIPIKCWIHTHPFGQAYFSSTDWSTINTWKPILKSAIVLGDNQYLAFNPETIVAKKVFYGLLEQKSSYSGEEE